jgi:adenylate kinase
MKSVIFIAPPAAGKGTQSNFLKSLGYIHISTGDMLRSEIATGSDLGKEIDEIIRKGDLVSDELVIKLIDKKLSSIDNKPFILDGFPRTINQAKELEVIFNKYDIEDFIVIYLDLDLDTAIKRSLGRLTCKCGRSYNIYFDNMKPMVDNICDDCKSELIKRDDDNEESFKVRFDNYLSNVAPIKEYYNNLNKLVYLDANKESNLVSEEIKGIIK